MQPMYYSGLDVHKRKISYCGKDASGQLHTEGWIPATGLDRDHWMKTLPQPWSAAMEAPMFTGWIYDHLKPHAVANATFTCSKSTCSSAILAALHSAVC
jgi:transposase